MKLFITGGSGLLGSKLAEVSIDRGYEVFSGYKNNPPSFGKPTRYDLFNWNSIEETIEKIKPDIIVHSAAMTNVDKCEENPTKAFQINALATKKIAKIAKKQNIYLLYISTDYVFDGERGNYREEEEVNPINVYGFTKYFGEIWVENIGRTSVIYGAKPASGKINFALWIIEKLKKEEEIKIIEDQYITPTLNTNLALMILDVIDRKLEGVYHLAGATRISRYEFAVKLAETFNFDRNLIKKSKMMDMKWKAKRPKDSSLNTEKVSKELRNKPYTLTESLQLLKKEYEEDM